MCLLFYEFRNLSIKSHCWTVSQLNFFLCTKNKEQFANWNLVLFFIINLKYSFFYMKYERKHDYSLISIWNSNFYTQYRDRTSTYSSHINKYSFFYHSFVDTINFFFLESQFYHIFDDNNLNINLKKICVCLGLFNFIVVWR